MTALLDGETIAGMVHLPPLPGAPRFEGDREKIVARARRDARELVAGGVDAVLVENYGDAPYYPDDVPAHVVASMTHVVDAVRRDVDCAVGVNVLRNDAEAAVSVAAATGASFVRVNVHAGARVTDQGVVEGRAHDTLRLRDRLDADVTILADVDVKHSTPLGRVDSSIDAAERGLADRVGDVAERGLADGIVVSGAATGEAVDRDSLDAVAATCDRLDVPLFVGSGVTPATAADVLDVADGVVVGTALKENGETTAPVDRSRVEALVEAAR